MLKNMDADEKLIRLVKQHQCLYNIQAKEYVDKKSKYRAWAQISQEMNLTISECTKKWKILRDCYRKAVRVRQQMVSAGRPCRRPIKFEKNLKFLVPYLVDRRPALKRDRPGAEPQADCTEMLSRLHRHLTDANLANTDTFFLTMSRKVRAMPRRVQAEVERDIFRIVNEAEARRDRCRTTAIEIQYIMPAVDPGGGGEGGRAAEYTSHEYSVPRCAQVKREVLDDS